MNAIVGLDLSLTCSGMFALPPDWRHDWESTTHGNYGYTLSDHDQATRCERIRTVADRVLRFVDGVLTKHGSVEVFTEQYAFSARSSSVTKLAELGGAVRYVLLTELGLVTREMAASRARSFLLGKLPRKNAKNITQATVREFCPLELVGDEIDAFVVANAGLVEIGGVGITLGPVS